MRQSWRLALMPLEIQRAAQWLTLADARFDVSEQRQRSKGKAARQSAARSHYGPRDVSVPAGIERTFPAAGMRFWNLVIPLVLPGW